MRILPFFLTSKIHFEGTKLPSGMLLEILSVYDKVKVTLRLAVYRQSVRLWRQAP
jgi:hypothetical protein